MMAMLTIEGMNMMPTSANGTILLRAGRPSPKTPRRLCTASALVEWPRPSRGPS